MTAPGLHSSRHTSWAHSCRPVMRSTKIVSFDRFCRVFQKLFPLSKPKISTTVTPSPSRKAVPALKVSPFNVAAVETKPDSPSISASGNQSPLQLLPLPLFARVESVMSFHSCASQSFVLPFEPDTSLREGLQIVNSRKQAFALAAIPLKRSLMRRISQRDNVSLGVLSKCSNISRNSAPDRSGRGQQREVQILFVVGRNRVLFTCADALPPVLILTATAVAVSELTTCNGKEVGICRATRAEERGWFAKT
jgi:hypothetical protein